MSKEYIELENGKTVEFLDYKNEEVIKNLQDIIED